MVQIKEREPVEDCLRHKDTTFFISLPKKRRRISKDLKNFFLNLFVIAKSLVILRSKNLFWKYGIFYHVEIHEHPLRHASP